MILSQIGMTDTENCKIVELFNVPESHAILDFTTTLSYLPEEYMSALTSLFPDGEYNHTEQIYSVPCSHRAHDATIDFYFDDVEISVPMRDFILEVQDTCYLGAVENRVQSGVADAVLGVSFLRGAYSKFLLQGKIIPNIC